MRINIKMMIMKYIIILAIVFISLPGVAQKYFTKEAHLTFISEAPLETIEGNNNKGMSVLDLDNGNIEFAVLIKAFHFEKALMEEHFNENYMQSSKYPKSTFKGQILNLDDVDFSMDGTYEVQVKGDMTIHGVTNEMETSGKIIVKDGALFANSQFGIAVADYKIKIPKVVADNIAKSVQIEVDLAFELLQQ